MNNQHKIRLSVFLFIFEREVYIYCVILLKRPDTYARAREELNPHVVMVCFTVSR